MTGIRLQRWKLLEVNRRAHALYRRLGFVEARRIAEGPAVEIRMVAAGTTYCRPSRPTGRELGRHETDQRSGGHRWVVSGEIANHNLGGAPPASVPRRGSGAVGPANGEEGAGSWTLLTTPSRLI